jgi:multisubunit Na+/H+ antiporter MnhC subunit
MNIFMGSLLMFWGVFGLIYIRKQPQKVVGLTFKQFNWCCVVAIVGGGITILAPLLDKK